MFYFSYIEVRSKNYDRNSLDDKDLRNWKLWGKAFTRQGLGGHMSRAHPGESVDYK